MNKKPSITLDTNIVFDFLNPGRSHHRDAIKVVNNPKIKLFITQTVIKEVKVPGQITRVNELITQNKFSVLDEPQMGTPIPTPIPMDLSHISAIRDSYINNYLSSHPGKQKHKVLRDFLIAEAHMKNNNDYLLTTNTRDFYENLDINIVNYSDLFRLLHHIFS